MNIAELRILIWMNGMTGENRIRNKYVRDIPSFGVGSMVQIMRENRLR